MRFLLVIKRNRKGATTLTTIDRSRIKMLTEREESCYVAERPKSQALFERAKASLLEGVPMSWMLRWAGPFPVFVKEANGTYLTDVDGHRYLDLCLGDTGAMFGHSPTATAEAIADQVHRGITSMLPTEDSIWVGEDLARRFGLSYWQIYMTATNANKFALRVARQTTKRNLILVYDGCYHGSLDETLVNYRRERIMGQPPPDLELTTRVIQFNDLDALEAALSSRDIACVICEPAMTDVGIIYPVPGYHEALREMTRRFGTLLIIDETHTICGGPGGLTRAWSLEPDIFTLGKPVAGGFPAAVMGLSREVTQKFMVGPPRQWDMGLGGTLSGNALAVAALRATLEHVITKSAYDCMTRLAERLTDGIDGMIKAADLPWHVLCLGCRVEYRFCPTPPRNGEEAIAAYDTELDRLVHLFFLNRSILLTPFHDMMLVSPETTAEDVDFHNRVFSEFVNELVG